MELDALALESVLSGRYRGLQCRSHHDDTTPAPAAGRGKVPIPIDIDSALSQAAPLAYWTDTAEAPDRADPVAGQGAADLVIVGSGFSGLWAALQAVDDSPGRTVAVVEAETAGFGASSRNGGFLEASLTHGLANGEAHWPSDIEKLEELGMRNFEAIVDYVGINALDVGLEVTGATGVATQPWHIEEIEESSEMHARHRQRAEMLDRASMRTRLDSPTYIAGLFVPDGTAIVDPARLAWGLRGLAEAKGVRFFDDSPVSKVERDGTLLAVRTPKGTVAARKVLVATNAYRSPVRSARRYIVPVYDYVLMTEPLSAAQMASIGWDGREGVADVSNQFHYYRLTVDNRILWGGYDAVYRFNNAVGSQYDQAGSTHRILADHFFDTFPQLEGLRFTHRWGGPIATTTQFTATWGTSYDGDLSWVGGYTGLGVGATRFGARVALDLLDGRSSEFTDLDMVRSNPMPFPPEPLRYAGIQMTRRAIARSDANSGRRGPWLRALDRFGLGFDS